MTNPEKPQPIDPVAYYEQLVADGRYGVHESERIDEDGRVHRVRTFMPKVSLVDKLLAQETPSEEQES